MNSIDSTIPDRDAYVENLAAELTDAAYPVVLRHGVAGSSIDLELDLWRALGETVQRWERGIAQAVSPSKTVHGGVRGGTKTLGAYAAVGCHPATLSTVVGLGHWRDARLSFSGE